MKSRLTLGFTLVVCLAILTAFVQEPGSQQRGASSPICAACHSDSDPATGPDFDFEKIAGSAHAGFACSDCHPGVTATHDADLPPADCGNCHEETAKEFNGSIHARSHDVDMTCSTCHDGHNIQPIRHDDTSKRLPVSETCGRCHADELAAFGGSIHYKALLDDNTAHWAPDCTTCHGTHRVYAAAAPASPSSATHLPGTCGGCHDNAEFAESVGIPEDRLASYKDSIHGLRNRFGQANVATCKDCHGFHSVLPASDPASSISKENVVGTCAKCHEGANENFASAKVHITATPDSSFGVFIARWFYIIFIAVLMLGFLMHVFFDLASRKAKKEEAKNE